MIRTKAALAVIACMAGVVSGSIAAAQADSSSTGATGTTGATGASGAVATITVNGSGAITADTSVTGSAAQADYLTALGDALTDAHTHGDDACRPRSATRSARLRTSPRNPTTLPLLGPGVRGRQRQERRAGAGGLARHVEEEAPQLEAEDEDEDRAADERCCGGDDLRAGRGGLGRECGRDGRDSGDRADRRRDVLHDRGVGHGHLRDVGVLRTE